MFGAKDRITRFSDMSHSLPTMSDIWRRTGRHAAARGGLLGGTRWVGGWIDGLIEAGARTKLNSAAVDDDGGSVGCAALSPPRGDHSEVQAAAFVVGNSMYYRRRLLYSIGGMCQRDTNGKQYCCCRCSSPRFSSPPMCWHTTKNLKREGGGFFLAFSVG